MPSVATRKRDEDCVEEVRRAQWPEAQIISAEGEIPTPSPPGTPTSEQAALANERNAELEQRILSLDDDSGGAHGRGGGPCGTGR